MLSESAAAAAVAVAPLATAGPEALAPLLNAVPTGLTSTSSRNWSPGLGSVTPASKVTDRAVAIPPAGMGVLPSLWSWLRPVGALGGTGTDVLKSGGLSGFPSSAVQSLARPV